MEGMWKTEDELWRVVTDQYVLHRRVIFQYLIMILFDWGQSKWYTTGLKG